MRGLLTRPNVRLALVTAPIAVAYLAATRGYKLGTLPDPGPGAFPLALGSALLVCALFLVLGEIVPGWRHAAESHPPPPPRVPPAGAHGRVLAFTAVLIAYPIAAGRWGFEVATAAGLIGMAYVMGERRPAALTLLAMAGAAATFVVFRTWLGIPLP